MNKLPNFKRLQILDMLVEGRAMRPIANACGVSVNSVSKLQRHAGETCLAIHDRFVTNIAVEDVCAKETWSFYGNGQKDACTWTAIDPATQLIISFVVGPFDSQHAARMVEDLQTRIAGSVQLIADNPDARFLRRYVGLLSPKKKRN